MFYREKVLGGLLSDNSSVLPSVLHLGAGFGLTVTKQEDGVPYALHKQYKASTSAAALWGMSSNNWIRATECQWVE